MEAAPQVADRSGPAGRRPQRLAVAARQRRARARGKRHGVGVLGWRRPPRTAAARGWPPAHPRPRRAGGGPGRASAAAGSAGANTSTAAARPRRTGACGCAARPRPSLPASASSSTSPASRRSVSRMARWRISSSATTVAACCRISRSASPSPPASRTATSHALRRPAPARGHRQRQRAPGQVRVVGRELGRLGGRPRPSPSASAHAPARSALDRGLGDRPAERALGHDLAARVQHQHRASDRRRQRARHLAEPPLLQHQPLQALVGGDPALEHLVLLVHQPPERLLGDGDERQLVRHLEHREAQRAGLVHQRLGDRVVLEAGAEAHAGQVVVAEPARELALALGAGELQPGGQDQLAARQPRRGVVQLADVHPADRRLGGLRAAHQLQTHLVHEGPEREHRAVRCPAA